MITWDGGKQGEQMSYSDSSDGSRTRRAAGFRAWRARRASEQATIHQAADEATSTGPGFGTASLGFTDYHPSVRRDEPALAELGFLAPRRGRDADRHTITINPRVAGF